MSRKNLKYIQSLTKRKEFGDMSMNAIAFDIPSVKELMKSPFATFISLSANDCGYDGSTKGLLVS